MKQQAHASTCPAHACNERATNATERICLSDSLTVCDSDQLAVAAGLAHLLEHMAFKGTARIGALDFKRESAILDTLDEGASS